MAVISNQRTNRRETSDYANVLEYYWNGRPQTTIEHLSKLIADKPDHPDRLRFYRLWIEVLASQNEFSTLSSLVDHLHLLGMMEVTHAASFLALRGIAYLEMDQFSAAMLCYKGLVNTTPCDYCNELKFRLADRVKQGTPFTDLVGQVNQLQDYFHLQTVGLIAQRKRHKKLLDSVGKRAKKISDRSPLMLSLGYQTAMDQRNYKSAIDQSQNLIEILPGNIDNYVFCALANIRSAKIAEAKSVLQRAIAIDGTKDIDVLSLYYWILKQNRSQTNETSHIKQQLDQQLGELGMETSSHSTTEKGNVSEPGFWLVKTDEHESFALAELRDGHSKNKTLTRTLSEGAKPGDIVFFASSDYRNRSTTGNTAEWRLTGVFEVITDPQWSPVDGFRCTLKELALLPQSVPFEVHFNQTQHIDRGVIGLDADGLDMLASAIKDFYSDNTESESHFMHDLAEKLQAS